MRPLRWTTSLARQLDGKERSVLGIFRSRRRLSTAGEEVPRPARMPERMQFGISVANRRRSAGVDLIGEILQYGESRVVGSLLSSFIRHRSRGLKNGSGRGGAVVAGERSCTGGRALRARLFLDASQVNVPSTSPAAGSVVAIPMGTLDVTFDGPVRALSVGTIDLSLSRGTVTAATLQSPKVVRFTMSELTSTEGPLTATIRAGAVSDVDGKPSSA